MIDITLTRFATTATESAASVCMAGMQREWMSESEAYGNSCVSYVETHHTQSGAPSQSSFLVQQPWTGGFSLLKSRP